MTDPAGPADFDAAMADLGIRRPPAAWRAGWAESQAAFPAGGVDFLTEPFLRRTCGRIDLPGDVTDGVVSLLGCFRRRPALRRLAWHCWRVLFGRDAREVAPRALLAAELPWPHRPAELPPWGPAFHPPVLLAGAEYVRALHAGRGIPQEVTRRTLADLAVWMRHYRDRTGRWGLAEAGWLAGHFLGRLYALGRLQFRFETFGGDCHAFRHVETGRVVLLAGGGSRFRRDGQFDGAGGVRDEAAWEAAFSADGGAFRGHPVRPDARALPHPVALPADRWREVLRPGDPVLGVHIPATGPLDHAACGESFRRAAAFFRRHWPEFEFRAFQCTSWFLDNQLDGMLPETSNIVRFQRELYLFPLPGASDEQAFERVFGGRPVRLDDAPRDTTLRRALLAHLRAGGHLHACGGLLLPEDLDWGGQVYRTAAGPDGCPPPARKAHGARKT